jgi:hypothetical protein
VALAAARSAGLVVEEAEDERAAGAWDEDRAA